MTYCKRHRVSPVVGYHECPACEIEDLRAQVEKGESEVKKLHGTILGERKFNEALVADLVANVEQLRLALDDALDGLAAGVSRQSIRRKILTALGRG